MKKRRKRKQNSTGKVIASISATCLVFALVLVVLTSNGISLPFLGGSSGTSDSSSNFLSTSSDEMSSESSETPVIEDEYTSATLCFAGDIVQHTPLNNDAYNRNGEYDFTYMYEYAREYFEAADYAACCIETTLNTANRPISGYPAFCSPDGVAYSLKEVGMDLIATASNHANDTQQQGINQTLDVLDEAGLDHVGTYRTQEERDENNGILLKNINDISIAFLNYSYNTNFNSIDSYPYAVNVYYNDYMGGLTDINYDMVGEDMEAARAMNPDLIVVMVHWGVEYTTTQTEQQEVFADFLFEEGADLIIGGHPHVPEPMEIREIDNGDGTTRTGYIVYSLGNFISNQNYATLSNGAYTNLTAIVNIDITKNITQDEVTITNIEYAPMYLAHPNESNTGHYCLLDINKAIAEYEAGDYTYVNSSLYTRLQEGLEDLHRIFGYEEVVLERTDPAEESSPADESSSAVGDAA